MNLNEDLAREIVRERSTRRYATQRPTRPRTARILRRIAERIDPAC